jgi:hypothetical protein
MQHGQQQMAAGARRVSTEGGAALLFDPARTALPAGFRRAQLSVYGGLFFGGGLGGRQVKVHLVFLVLFDADGGRFEL